MKKQPAKKTDSVLPPAVPDRQQITDTLETNYMPYAMSVIVSRAIPEIDGFKPSHRKLLYTMYHMGLLNGGLTKSANVVGQTMRLNPHGDAAIYETMVRLTRGYEALIAPFVESKGSFGKQYSRDMAYAAPRYTEVKLAPICSLLFSDIDKDTVDFQDNYDATMKEPVLLPCAFPNILVNPNTGIAVGMASSICSFNLAEVCNTTIALIKNPEHDLATTLPAPDFAIGGELLYDRDTLDQIYQTGRGSFKLRSVWSYDQKNNCIEITQIPYTTTVEAIMDKIVELAKNGKVKELADVRDETDLKGLKLTLDLKRGVDPDRLMQKLFNMTPLQDSFPCNFNVLIGGMPKVLGVRELLQEWVAFRAECVRRRVYFDLQKKKDRLHLLQGLKLILLDIDKAVAIVKNTEEDAEVVPNLMIGFGVDEVQAEYIAEIKLRNLNRQYILRALEDIKTLQTEIADCEDILKNRKRVDTIICDDLAAAAKKFGIARRTQLIYPHQQEEPYSPEEHIEDYPVNLFVTKEGYFKKITPLSLRMGGEQKLKEGDCITQQMEATNKSDLLFFTNKAQVYKARAYDFEDSKASVLGDYIPTKLDMEEGEQLLFVAETRDYQGFLMVFFANGRVAKIDLASYATKQNRKKLTGAFCSKFPVVAFDCARDDQDYTLVSTADKILVFHSASVPKKAARDTQGVIVMTLRAKHTVQSALPVLQSGLSSPASYKTRTLPSAGRSVKTAADDVDQLKL